MSKYRVTHIESREGEVSIGGVVQDTPPLLMTEYEIEAADLSDAQQMVLEEFDLHIEKID